MRGRALAGFAAAGIGLSAVPFFGPPAFYESFLYLVFHWIVLAVSWNILSGYSGYFSFGHGAFFGAGMYTTATLATKAGVPFLWTLPAAALVAAAFGVDVRRLSLLLSGLSAAFAGVAGLCLALSYTLAPGQIYAWLGVVFAAVMLGGLGNPLGPLVAGIVIGVSEALTMAFTAPAWAPLVSFSLLIVVLLARPGRI